MGEELGAASGAFWDLCLSLQPLRRHPWDIICSCFTEKHLFFIDGAAISESMRRSANTILFLVLPFKSAAYLKAKTFICDLKVVYHISDYLRDRAFDCVYVCVCGTVLEAAVEVFVSSFIPLPAPVLCNVSVYIKYLGLFYMNKEIIHLKAGERGSCGVSLVSVREICAGL